MLSEPPRTHPSLSSEPPAFRRLRIVALCLLTAAAGGFVISRFLPPTYLAAARVQLAGSAALPDQAEAPLPPATAPAPELQAEAARLRDAAFTRGVGQALGRDVPPAYLTYAVNPGSATLEVRAESTRPEAAAAWANTAATLAVDQARARRQELLDRERTARWAAAAAGWSEVRRAAGALARLRQQVRQSGQDQALDQRLREQVQLAEKERSARGAVASLDAKIAVVRDKLARVPRTVVAPVSRPNPEWQSLNAQLTTVRAERARLAETSPETSPEIQRLDTRIRDLQTRLAAKKPTVQERREQPNPAWQALNARMKELETHHAAATRLAGELSGASQRLRALVDQLSPWQEQAQRLARELAEARAKHAQLARRLREFQQWERRLPPAALVTVAAVPSHTPLHRAQLPQLGLALLAGLCCGIVLAFRPEPARRIHEPRDASRLTGWPVLSVLPAAGEENPLSPEALGRYRALGASLRFASVTHPVQVLLVLAPEPAGDYGAVSANVARSLARSGMRVLLVDADPERPEVHRRFGVRLEPGLTTVLLGRAELAEALERTSCPDLRVLPAGPPAPHLPAALQSEPLTRLLTELREHADFVLVEAPPDLHPELLQAVARGVDGVMVVLDRGQTTGRALRDLRDRLAAAGAPVLGLVVRERGDLSPTTRTARLQGLRVPDELRAPRHASARPAAGAVAAGTSQNEQA